MGGCWGGCGGAKAALPKRANTITLATTTASGRAMAEKIDPYDVAALERSLNDSATRVSTIWVSFLIFSLYLLSAAATVTHRQLFLAEPVKLPVLNIDLPLWGFFFLGPILFVIFHAYVLLQVLLLGRTASAYNEAIDRVVKPPPANAAMRQRLANTLFAQIFAGSPRERDGWLGYLLKAMAWITLAIVPVCILLVFQFAFLPYHSQIITWTQRIFVMADAIVVFALWPIAVDPRKEVSWRNPIHRPVVLILTIMLLALSGLLMTFPGEPHGSWLRYFPKQEEGRWILRPDECRTESILHLISRDFDRLSLQIEDFVDDDALAKIESAGAANGRAPSLSERTRTFRGRDFACGDFSLTDLRRVDFTLAKLAGAIFDGAELQGTSFALVDARKASFASTELQSANFDGAILDGAEFSSTNMQGALLKRAKIRGALFSGAKMQGASFSDSIVRGSEFSASTLHGADFSFVRAQATDFSHASLIGAIFSGAQLQGSDFERSDLRGADFGGAQLQGAILRDARLTLTNLRNASVWRTSGAICGEAQLRDLNFRVALETVTVKEREGPIVQVVTASSQAESFIKKIVEEMPEIVADEVEERLRLALISEMRGTDEVEHIWKKCAETTLANDEYERKLARFLADQMCQEAPGQQDFTESIIRRYAGGGELDGKASRPDFDDALARHVLGIEGNGCAIVRRLSPELLEILHKLATRRN